MKNKIEFMLTWTLTLICVMFLCAAVYCVEAIQEYVFASNCLIMSLYSFVLLAHIKGK